MNRISGLTAVLAISGIVACNNGGSEDSDAALPCDFNSVEETFPTNGTTNAYYRTSIEARLDDADEAATLEVDGVSGSVEVIEDRIVFTPDTPLDSATDYTMTVSYTGEDGSTCTVDASFTTSEVGSALGDATSLEGRAYDLDLESGRFVEPEGVGALLGEYLGDVTLYLNVDAATATTIDMIGALGDDVDPTMQAACDPTIPFPQADFSNNPFFEVNAVGTTTNITVSGITVAIEDLLVSGAFSPNGDYIAGGVLSGRIDTRPLVDLVEEGGAEDAICELAGSIGVDCEDCGNGDVFCLSLFVDDLTAAEATGTTITEMTDVCAQANAETVCPDDCPAN